MPLINPPQKTGPHSNAQLALKNASPEQKDPTWMHAANIDSTRWNKSYPYQLLMVKKNPGSANDPGYTIDPKWTFTLPIGPESISISMPFAISGNVTLDGYHEEHGGAPIRMISFNGTTGVMPLKGSAPIKPTDSLGAAIFGGTINKATAIKTAGTALRRDLLGTDPFTNTITDSEMFDIVKGSGYYQFRLLQQWFENYAAFKKTKAGRDYRMVLAMWKDEALYFVTPQAFNVQRSASSPLEYPYSISFKAWKRKIGASANPKTTGFVPVSRDPSKLGNALKAIDDARRVLETLTATISAIAGDINHALFEPLREICLFAKDALGIPLALNDLPVQIVRDAKYAIITAVSVKQAADGIAKHYTDNSDELDRQIAEIAALGQKTSTTTTGDAILAQKGLDDKITAQIKDSTSPGNDPFNNPSKFSALFRQITLGSINMKPPLVASIIQERERVRRLQRLDFEQRRDVIVQLSADFAAAVGASHPTYDSTFTRPIVNTTRTPTPTDFKIMYALNRVILEVNRLAASGEINQSKVSSINYMAGLASGAGLAFQVPKSKFAVPFMYGSTIEQMATRYLGNPDRWIELVALNGLRAPYVDEVGFDLPLLTNGRRNEVIIGDSSNLFIGQQVWLSSTTTSRTIRRITKIQAIAPDQAILTLDGDADLDRFSTLAMAYLHAFLPDTVNSMMSMYIPSDNEPGEDDYQVKEIPGIDQFDPLLEAGGMDLLLTPDGDLAITPDGDCLLAIGLQNIVQIAWTRISVIQGTLNRHPGFGLPIKIGMSTADLDAQTLLNIVKDLFNDDTSITGVKGVSVNKMGPATTIAMQLQVSGISQYIPVSFDLAR